MNSTPERHTCILGVNHKSAAVDMRDQVVFTHDEISAALSFFKTISCIKEVILISTCNRTEGYFIVDQEPEKCRQQILTSWLAFKGLDRDLFSPCFFFHAHLAAVEHLFKVASSLDSMVVGEAQILGQIKKAYHDAKENNTTDLYLNRLFQEAIKIGKRVRSETEINKGAVSISYAAVELLRKKTTQLSALRIGIVGTGKMGELSVKNLIEQGVSTLHFINRTFENAQKMADAYNGRAWNLKDIEEALQCVDILICSATACEPIITKEHFKGFSRPTELILVDIAAPRNISPDVAEIEGVTVYDIDDLTLIVDENLDKRKGSIEQVEKIIEEELTKFYGWYSAQEIVPVLKAMRVHIYDIAQNELKTLAQQLGEQEYDAVKQAIHTLTNKILHTPSQALKEMCIQGDAATASHYTKELFGLKL